MEMYFFYTDKMQNVRPEFFAKLNGDFLKKYKDIELSYIFFKDEKCTKIVNALKKSLGTSVYFVDIDSNVNIDKKVEMALSSCPFAPCIVCKDDKLLSSADVVINMVNEYKNGYDIISTKPAKTHSKIKNFFRKILNFVANFVYKCTLYKGNENLIMFSEYAVNIMKVNVKNTQKFSKVNCFIKLKETTVDNIDVKTKHKNKKEDIVKMSIFFASFFVLLAFEILLGVLTPQINKIYVHSIFIIIELVCLIVACLDIIKLLIIRKVGPLYDDYII